MEFNLCRKWFDGVPLGNGDLGTLMHRTNVTIEFYVAPDGQDRWSGRLKHPNAMRSDGPLASLTGARDAIRRLKAKGKASPAIKVQIAGGHYVLTQPVVFSGEDSGTKNCPIAYEAAKEARVIIEGGRQITGFKKGADGIWFAQIPGVARGARDFEQLFVNGRRAERARMPGKFYYHIIGPVKSEGAVEGSLENIPSAFAARGEDIKPLAELSPEQLAHVTVVIYHSWETSRSRIASIDVERNTVELTARMPLKISDIGDTRYALENFKEALQESGQWCLDPDGTLYYKPLAGEDMAKTEVWAPATEQFVIFAGSPEKDEYVEHIWLNGLIFRHGQYILPRQGHVAMQSECAIPAVIQGDGMRQIVIKNCEISHIGTSGVWLRRGCAGCRIEHNYIHDIGAAGVRIGEAWMDLPAKVFANFKLEGKIEDKPKTVYPTGFNVVDNNIIRTGGLIHMGANGIWIGQSGDNQITHNEVCDFRYSGISVGWAWGYVKSLAERNAVEFNHVHHIGRGILCDLGGIYTLGVSPGTAISSNCIHDVEPYRALGWGIYLDEGSSYITVANNLVYNIGTCGCDQHYGKENTVRNNIFAFGFKGQIQRQIQEEHLSLRMEHNIVYGKKSGVLLGPWDKNAVFAKNLYFNAAGKPLYFGSMSFAEWQQSGQDAGSIVADPGFIDANSYDFHLRPNSPALTLGFKLFDYTKAGVYGDAEWTALAKNERFATVELPPRSSVPVQDGGFEETSVGKQPPGVIIGVEGKGDSIAVTDEAAIHGKHSLKITIPGRSYHCPHLAYRPYFPEGQLVCNFDIRLKHGLDLDYECRDLDAWIVGPSFKIRNKRISVGGKEIMELPLDTWLHIEVKAMLGLAANGIFDLEVTLPSNKPQSFNGLRCRNPGWDLLTWMGFLSAGTGPAVFYLDNMDVRNIGG